MDRTSFILSITFLLGKEDDVEDYEYDDGLEDTEEMTSYERVMRGKRSAEDYDEDYDEDYEDEDIEDYDDLVNDGEDEDEEALNLWVGQLKFGFNHCTRSRLNSHKCQIEVWLNVNLNVKSVTL